MNKTQYPPAVRRPWPDHVCGVNGFDPAQGDRCRACDYYFNRPRGDVSMTTFGELTSKWRVRADTDYMREQLATHAEDRHYSKGLAWAQRRCAEELDAVAVEFQRQSERLRAERDYFAQELARLSERGCGLLKSSSGDGAVQHVCGLQGFGAVGDVCPACARSRASASADARPGMLRKMRSPHRLKPSPGDP